ncbi:MAG: Hsp20/alpha crystallin family protein [Proteobacteria bacterium]|nr:Hsp20/alpha crystallin family protein [Pseudomonadota bacterium]MCH9711614.1 Hsp20/alpha crystallin family protein [Pseudomonadota bacterium]MCH9750182.1 Hsp20/alpha crystallin family protein [Pseudomonadota bacterium]
MKNTLLITLLVSTSVFANQPFQNNFFDRGFHQSVWSNFNQQFQQFNNEMRAVQNRNIFGAQTKRYFDEQSNRYMIEIEVQGLAKKDLDITSENGMIHIKGHVKKIEKMGNNTRTSSNQFSQSYSLPNDADANNIGAEFKNSCLVISIPKLVNTTPIVKQITVQ